MLMIVSRIALARAGAAKRGERRAVLDDAPLAAVVPDEVRDLVDVGMRAGHERREAHGRQRRETVETRVRTSRARRARRASARASPTASSNIDGRQPVDDDQKGLSRGQGSAARHVAPPAVSAGAVPRRAVRVRRGTRAPGRRRAPPGRARRRRRTPPSRAESRRVRSAPRTVRGRAERPEHTADAAGDRAGPVPEQPADHDGDDDRDRQREPHVAKDAEAEHAERGTEARTDADPVPATHAFECTDGVCAGRVCG